MTSFGLILLVVVVVIVVILVAKSIRMVQQYEQGIVFRFGKLTGHVRGPGLTFVVPFVDRMAKVSMQTVVLGVPAQGAITRDNVTLTVDAVIYFKVIDPVKAVVNVQNYQNAVSQVSQTSLRSVIGRVDLDTLLSDREQINSELKSVIDGPTEVPWGLRIERVEVKDIALPESMKRSMSRQAEAERERRARVISADGEFQASARLADAAQSMAATPGAQQLRLQQTVGAAEKTPPVVLPCPVALWRCFDRAAEGAGAPAAEHADEPAASSPVLSRTPTASTSDLPPVPVTSNGEAR